ncbi:MAG: xanthine dehydrogenase family protein molybdopterin-binding subunit, partial [Chloroflexi bacterium]|nr:xanthine dehydrogenase family protein molybdopterin-binding subunit [Chloroflexota bacterium]
MARKVKTVVEVEGHLEEVEVEVPEEDLPPWKEGELSWVGKGLPRVEGLEKCTGRARYTCDIQLPGMLYGMILRSPHPHPRLVKLDASRARQLPGVKAILSYENAGAIPWYDDSFLFDRQLRYAGEEVAAVAAESEQSAADALALIRVEYEVLPFVVDPEEALRSGAPAVRAGGNLQGGQPLLYSRGDVEKGLAEADVIVEESFSTQVQGHACWETHGSVASWQGDRLTVWDSTQGISAVREGLARALKMPMHKVRVIKEFMGGGFGSKTSVGKYTMIAALLARMTGRPVKIALDRKSEFLSTGHRPSSLQQVKLGAKKDGTLTAIYLKNLGGCGAHRSMLPSPLSLVDATSRPYRELYRCPNLKTEAYPIYTHIPVNTPQRAPGHVEGTFALEQAMDMLAERLGMDPLTLRLKNYALKDQVRDLPYTSKALDQCYQQGARAIGWKDRKRRAGEGTGSVKRGIGMASQTWGGGGGPPAHAIVKLHPDGTVHILTGTQDIGTGNQTALCQIAAEELGIDLPSVSLTLGDTEVTYYAPTSSGSRTLPSVGPAVRAAAAAARDKLLELAAPLLSARPEELAAREGWIFLKSDPNRRVSIPEA